MAQIGPLNGYEIRQYRARSKPKQTAVGQVRNSLRKTNPPHTRPPHEGRVAPLEEVSYICGDCGRSFVGHLYFAEHQKTHQEKTYKCVECEQPFLHETSLLRHLQSHSGLDPFKCMECHQCFGKDSELLQHQCVRSAAHQWKNSGEAPEMSACRQVSLRTRTRGKNCHQSTLCAGSLSGAWHLDQHEKADKAPHHIPCHTGHQHVHNGADFERPEKRHNGVTPHQCPHCKSTFRLRGSLTLHMKIHRNLQKPD
ncbi:uncharacterized protein LOC144817664 [Lissotriton helveticus]